MRCTCSSTGPGFLLRLPLGQIQPVRRLTRKQARAVRRKVNILIFSRADQSEQIFADGSLAFACKLRKLLQCAVGTLAQHALVCGDTPQRARFEKCAKCACEKPQRNEPQDQRPGRVPRFKSRKRARRQNARRQHQAARLAERAVCLFCIIPPFAAPLFLLSIFLCLGDGALDALHAVPGRSAQVFHGTLHAFVVPQRGTHFSRGVLQRGRHGSDGFLHFFFNASAQVVLRAFASISVVRVVHRFLRYGGYSIFPSGSSLPLKVREKNSAPRVRRPAGHPLPRT